MNKKKPTPELIKLAKEYPNGWMYELLPEYEGKAEVPMEGIVGAWQVDSKGNIIGEFIPKKDFDKH